MRRALLLAFACLPCAAASFAAPLSIDGEVIATRSAALSPPPIDGIWQFNITFLLADGTRVSQGQQVLVFDGATLDATLSTKRAALSEKLSEREKLRLEVAERVRTEGLATEQARADRDKAQRKASQPEDLLARVDYRKLVIDRELAERLLALAERREQLAAEQGRQEQRMLDAEITRLQAEVAQAEAGVAALRVVAPRDGIVVHRSSWNGEKFDVGSQVFRSQTVAEVPDPQSLAVRAQLPESDYLKVEIGAKAKVLIEGTGASLQGRVESIGRVVRSRSRLQPVPVVDLFIVLDGDSSRLKPGQPVRVEFAMEAAP